MRIKEKAGVIVEHFHSEVRNKIKGQARAMVVASSIKRAIEYYMAINKLLEERKSPYKAIVAFTGEIKYEAMMYADAQNARDESDRATQEAILKSLVTGTELYKAFFEDTRNKNNQSFKKWLLDFVFTNTYKPDNRDK